MRNAGRTLLIALVLASASCTAARAQTAVPSPSPSPSPNGFTAHAHATVSVAAGGGTFDVAVQLGVAQRDQATRFDVLSFRSAVLPIRIEGVALVVDRRAGTATIVNDGAKTYYTQSIVPSIATSAPPAPAASPTPAPPRPPRVRSGLADLEVFSATMRLTGHTTTLGFPTTGIALDLETRKKGEASSSRVAATMQLADDFAIFPMTLDLSLTPGATPYGGKFSYAVDDLVRDVPPGTLFETPAGYRRATSPFEVLFAQPRRPAAAPATR